MYYFSGFLSLQQAVDNWVWEYTGATPAENTSSASNTTAAYVDPTGGLLPQQNESLCAKPVPTMFPFPIRGYEENPFYNRVGYLLGLGLVMATLYPMSRLTKEVVEEKEAKLREVMKIMGMQDAALSLSWLASGTMLFLWVAVSTWMVTTSSFLASSDKSIMFLFFLGFCLSEVTLSLLISTFFSNSKLVSISAPAILFACILPRYIFFTTNDEEQWLAKYFTSLLSPTAFAFGSDAIANYEYSQIGIQWSNIEDGAFSFGALSGCYM